MGFKIKNTNGTFSHKSGTVTDSENVTKRQRKSTTLEETIGYVNLEQTSNIFRLSPSPKRWTSSPNSRG